MGYSATQVNLLALTARDADIKYALQDCSLKKTSLARDMSRVSKKYQDALNTKVYKWSNNGGVSYSDISYSTLMRPNPANGYKPYMLTNQSGKVVLDNQYKKYAEMISPNGAPGGDWASNRETILSELTKIPAEKIRNSEQLRVVKDDKQKEVNDIQKQLNHHEAIKTGSLNDFLKTAFGNGWEGLKKDKTTSKGVSSIADDYKNESWWSLGTTQSGATSNLNGKIDEIYSRVSNYLRDEDIEKFKQACEKSKDSCKGFIERATDANSTGATVMVKDNTYYVNAEAVIMGILTNFTGIYNVTDNTQFTYVKNGRDSNDYKDYENLQNRLKEANSSKKQADADYNEVLTSSEEQQIKFYDTLFEAIVNQGWVCDNNLEDSTYLNEMLQNNQFLIGNVEYYHTTDEKGNLESHYTFNTSTAGDSYNLFLVNDSAIQNEALAEYEYEKSIINEKEQRIDKKMKNLETEQSAIEKMMQSYVNIRDENGDRAFGIFA